MKPKHGPNLSRKLRRKDPFEIRSVGISPEDEITALVRSVISAGATPNKTQVTTAAERPLGLLKNTGFDCNQHMAGKN